MTKTQPILVESKQYLHWRSFLHMFPDNFRSTYFASVIPITLSRLPHQFVWLGSRGCTAVSGKTI